MSTTASTTTTTTSPAVFAISKSKGWRHYYLHQDSEKGPVVYNAVVHSWSPSKPSIELHSGSTENEPIVGFASIDSVGCNAQIALGDPAQKDSLGVTPEPMRERHAFEFKEYLFESDELDEGHERRSYSWTRTKNVPAHFECRDVLTGAVLAEFHSNGIFKWTKIGSLMVNMASPSARAVQYLMLVFLCWSEMENREAAIIAH